MTCTVGGLAKYLRDNIVTKDGDWVSIPECDFCIIDDDSSKCTLQTIRQNASRWYGLKVVNGGFNSDCLVLMADYYGGGCANITQIWYDGFGPSNVTISDLTHLIIDTLCVDEFAAVDTLLLVEFPKKYTVRLSALKYATVEVVAGSEKEALKKAESLYYADEVVWHSGELTDMVAEAKEEAVLRKKRENGKL